MIGVAADRHGGRLPEAGGAEGVAHLSGHAAGARHHADRSLGERLARVLGAAAEAADLGLAGRQDAEAVGADDAGALQLGELDHLRHLEAGNALGDDHDQRDAGVERLEDGVAGEGGRDGDDRRVDACVLHRVAHGVEHRHAVDVAAGAAGCHPAHHLGAEIEALARHAHRLAAGDALDDEGGVLGDENRHRIPFSPQRGTEATEVCSSVASVPLCGES